MNAEQMRQAVDDVRHPLEPAPRYNLGQKVVWVIMAVWFLGRFIFWMRPEWWPTP